MIDTRDAPDGTTIGWDQRGTADFFGIIIVLGDIEVRGTSGVFGGMIASGDIESKGLGSTWEINYNEKVFDAIRRTDHVISVNIVPNTWEEYTLPRSGGRILDRAARAGCRNELHNPDQRLRGNQHSRVHRSAP